MPVQWGEADGERVTPTGAAIVRALASPLGNEVVRVRRTGYGAGTRDYADAPNVLRLVLCEGDVEAEPSTPATGTPESMHVPAAEWIQLGGKIVVGSPPVTPAGAPLALDSLGRVHRGRVAVLRTTIDDMVPEIYGHLMETLFAAGALDVQYTAVQVKKDRPATQVTVIASPPDANRLAGVLLSESTTLGVRLAYEERYELERRAGSVETRFGSIAVKIAVRPDGTTRVTPEYESARRAAAAAGVPLDEVYREVLRTGGA
jgi:uncharacterized protein (DUF111 family)